MKIYTFFNKNHEPLFKEWFEQTLPKEFELLAEALKNNFSSFEFRKSGWQNIMIQKVEDDHVFVFAPYAPRFTDQIDIFIKKRERTVSNYVERRNRANWKIAEAVNNLNQTILDFLRA